jgi:NAD(P)H dehydrogenase (quinone)
MTNLSSADASRVLVVFAHPCPKSFNAALLAAVVETFRRRGSEVRTLDLNAMEFDPVMRASERRSYHTSGENEAPVADQLGHLRWCDTLVFVHPTWWYGPPAILKGWLERVFVPHATFSMPEKNRPIGRVLTNITRLGVVTTMGAPWWWWKFGVREPGRHMLLTGLKPLFHRRCSTIWLALHRMDTSSEAQRRAFEWKVRKRLAAF